MSWWSAFDLLGSLLRPLLCGDSPLTIIPFAIYLVSVAIFLWQVVSCGRPIIPAIAREIMAQEMVFVWILSQALKFWMWSVSVVDAVVEMYTEEVLFLSGPFPKQNATIFGSRGASKGRKLPLPLRVLLHPQAIKITLCFALALVPVLILQLTRRRRHGQPLFWLNGQHWDRSELGTAAFYLVRPFMQEEPRDPGRRHVVTNRASTGDIRGGKVKELRPSVSA